MIDPNNYEQDLRTPLWQVRFTDQTGQVGYFDVADNDRVGAILDAEQRLGIGEALLDVAPLYCGACDGTGMDRYLPDETPCRSAKAVAWSALNYWRTGHDQQLQSRR